MSANKAVAQALVELAQERDLLLKALESLVLFTTPTQSNAVALHNAHAVIKMVTTRDVPAAVGDTPGVAHGPLQPAPKRSDERLRQIVHVVCRKCHLGKYSMLMRADVDISTIDAPKCLCGAQTEWLK